MITTYKTIVIGDGNHASIEIPDENLKAIGGNRRAPLKVTIHGHTYQSTATVVDGQCRVVFPLRERKAAGVLAGEKITVTLELDSGYRNVDIPNSLSSALAAHELTEAFHDLTYSKRKEFARLVNEAKSEDTRAHRIHKIIDQFRI